MTEAPSHLSIPETESDNWSPERIFDVRWAATIVERALRRLGDECEKHGRRRVFDVLSSCLTADRQDVSYATFARILGIQETAVKNLVHRLVSVIALCSVKKLRKRSAEKMRLTTSCVISVPHLSAAE